MWRKHGSNGWYKINLSQKHDWENPIKHQDNKIQRKAKGKNEISGVEGLKVRRNWNVVFFVTKSSSKEYDNRWESVHI